MPRSQYNRVHSRASTSFKRKTPLWKTPRLCSTRWKIHHTTLVMQETMLYMVQHLHHYLLHQFNTGVLNASKRCKHFENFLTMHHSTLRKHLCEPLWFTNCCLTSFSNNELSNLISHFHFLFLAKLYVQLKMLQGRSM